MTYFYKWFEDNLNINQPLINKLLVLISELTKYYVFRITAVILLAVFLVLLIKKILKIATELGNNISKKIPPLTINNHEIISSDSIARLLKNLITSIKIAIIIILICLYAIFVFSLFPYTRGLVLYCFDHVVSTINLFLLSAFSLIPNFFSILLISFFTFYFLKGLRAITSLIATEKIKFQEFHSEWAYPTFKIVRFLIIILAIIMICPYLPGFDSPAFKGVSIFVGVLFSLGSTSAVGNIIAGILLIYMRSFKVGDRIKVNDVIGDVIEKSLLSTKIRTIKNIDVIIPNSIILNTATLNYSLQANTTGIIIHSTITIGYDAPWKKVHELLIDAALSTSEILKEPKPFVLQKSLDDYYVSYEINAYINSPNKMNSIYSSLHQNIQDSFNNAGLEIMSPQYNAIRDGNKIVIPDDYVPTNYTTPAFKISN